MRTEEEVRAELDAAQARLDAINQQLDEAKSRNAETGDFSDTDWFNRARAASRISGRAVGKLQVELGLVKAAQRKINHAESTAFSYYFMLTAKKMLPPISYEAIFQEALIHANGNDAEKNPGTSPGKVA